jgi:hypothetical protein
MSRAKPFVPDLGTTRNSAATSRSCSQGRITHKHPHPCVLPGQRYMHAVPTGMPMMVAIPLYLHYGTQSLTRVAEHVNEFPGMMAAFNRCWGMGPCA